MFPIFSLKRFLMLVIMLSSDCFFIFNLFDFFSLPYPAGCLPYSSGVFVVKRLTTLYLKPPTDFLMCFGI